MSTEKQTETGTEVATTHRELPPGDSVPSAKGIGSRFVASGAIKNGTPAIFEGFEDKSLPPIIKANDLQPGNVVIGRIIDLSAYKQDNIDSALVTLDILDVNEKGEFYPVGQKAAMPVGAVLARALGTKSDKSYGSEEQIADIKRGGFIGAIIAMRYNGTGKERGNGKAAPHLWDIKLKKSDGAVHQHSERVATPTAHAAPAKKK